MRKIMKLRYLGFIIGVILLITGWIIRGITFFLSFETTIIFYAFIVSKEEPPEELETLTEEQQKEKVKQELENISYKIKSSIGFTMVYGFMSILIILLSLCTIFINKLISRWSLSGLFTGIFLSCYYISKLFRQFKWLKEYKKYKNF